MIDQLPQDVNMLFSFVNMKLRDEFNSLNEMCKTLGIDKNWLIEKLATGGFEYNAELNKFW